MLILHFCGKTSYAEVTAAMAGIQSSLHELKVEDEDAGVWVVNTKPDSWLQFQTVQTKLRVVELRVV